MVTERGTLPPIHEIWTKAGPIETSIPETELRTIEERRQASIAEPGALGLFGFAVGTTVIAFVISGITPATSAVAAVPVLLVFAGIGQFIAGLFALAKGNTFAATAFGAYGANNTLVATFFWMMQGGLIPNTSSNRLLLAVSLLCFGYISLVLMIAAVRLNSVYVSIVAALVPGYTLAAFPWFGGSTAVGHWGGYFLFLAAALAFYAGSALVINSTHEQPLLAMGSARNGHTKARPTR
jgi:succinate-acetate transporter protein